MRCVIILAILLGVITTAKAEPYVSAFGGVTFPTTDTRFVLTPGVPTGNVLDDEDTIREKWDATAVFGGAVGYRFNLPTPGRLRVELEGAHRKNESGELTETVTGVELADGVFLLNGIPPPDQQFEQIQSSSAMLNIVYESSALSDTFQIYAGGGVGVAWTEYRMQSFTSVQIVDAVFLGALEDEQYDTTAFQWQVIAGLSAPLTSNLELFTEGRYARASGGINQQPTTMAFTADNLRISGPSALAGLRFSFN